MIDFKVNKYSPAILVVLFVMCSSMQLYFTWKFPVSIVNSISALLLLPYLLKTKVTQTFLFLIPLIFIVFLYNYTHNTVLFTYISFINFISVVIVSLFVISSSFEFKIRLYRGFDLLMKVICAISLLGWGLYLAGVSLPNYYSDTSEFYNHQVYYLFVMGGDVFSEFLPRFCGMFLEPGHIGSTACLLLYINKFDFKDKSNYIYFLSILFSLSLAAYLLFFIGLSLYYILKGSHIIKYLILLSLLAGTFYIFGTTYNDGDNIFNKKILSRLIIVDGKLSGDNRTSMVFDSYYDRWLKSGDIISGYGRKAYGDASRSTNLLHGTASYKRFFFINGIIGLFLIFTLYGLLFYKYSSWQGAGFLLVFLICNMIRDYPLRMMWLFIFVVGVAKFSVFERERRFFEKNKVISD